MKRTFLFLFLIILISAGCSDKGSREVVQRFGTGGWERFNILKFDIPIDDAGLAYDVYFMARFDQGFEYETLNFNMIMNTPSGEERIKEYEMKVKSKAGSFLFPCAGDSCLGQQLLKKELWISKPGVLVIEIENLTPRLRTGGIRSVGIRLEPSGK